MIISYKFVKLPALRDSHGKDMKKLILSRNILWAWYNAVDMLQEVRPSIVEAKERRAARLFSSQSARERIIRILKPRCSEIPEKADAALVLGTSLELYPNKFKKRVYTAVRLAQENRISWVIFSGKCDHETSDIDQALDAKNMAIFEFGLDEERTLTVGGDNTYDNLKRAKELLINSRKKIDDIYIISDGPHLIRTISLVDYLFKETNFSVYPFPILNEGEIDPNDPVVIEEVIKTMVYNRVLNKNDDPVSESTRYGLDEIVYSYTQKTRAMPRKPEVPFEEWKRTIVNEMIYYSLQLPTLSTPALFTPGVY